MSYNSACRTAPATLGLLKIDGKICGPKIGLERQFCELFVTFVSIPCAQQSLHCFCHVRNIVLSIESINLYFAPHMERNHSFREQKMLELHKTALLKQIK